MVEKIAAQVIAFSLENVLESNENRRSSITQVWERIQTLKKPSSWALSGYFLIALLQISLIMSLKNLCDRRNHHNIKISKNTISSRDGPYLWEAKMSSNQSSWQTIHNPFLKFINPASFLKNLTILLETNKFLSQISNLIFLPKKKWWFNDSIRLNHIFPNTT